MRVTYSFHPNRSTCVKIQKWHKYEKNNEKNAPEILLWKENFSIFCLGVCFGLFRFVGLFVSFSSIVYKTNISVFLFCCLILSGENLNRFLLLSTLAYLTYARAHSRSQGYVSNFSISYTLHMRARVCVCVHSFVYVWICSVDRVIFIRYFMVFVEVVKNYRLECFIELVWFFPRVFYLIFCFIFIHFLWFAVLVYSQLCTWHLTINSVCVCGFAIKLFIIIRRRRRRRLCFSRCWFSCNGFIVVHFGFDVLVNVSQIELIFFALRL